MSRELITLQDNTDETEHSSLQAHPQYPISIILSLVAFFLVAVGSYNYSRNAFLLFGSATSNQAASPRKLDLGDEYIAKKHLLEQINPKTVIIGTSKAVQGIDASSPFLKQPAMSYALPGSTITVHNRVLKHIYYQDPSAERDVYLFLDFPAFNTHLELNQKNIKGSSFDSYVKYLILDERYYTKFMYQLGLWRDRLWALMSLRAVSISNDLLSKQQEHNKMRPDGSWTQQVKEELSSRFTFLLLIHKYINEQLLIDGKPKHEFSSNSSHNTLEEFEDLLNFAHQHSINLHLAINPVHGMAQMALLQTGLLTIQEQWKKELTRINQKVATEQNKAPYPLWDFSDTTGFNTEEIAPKGKYTKWHYESVHFTPALGEIILENISDADNAAIQFGVQLTPDSIEQTVEQNRCSFLQYKATHNREWKEVSNITKRYTSVRPISALIGPCEFYKPSQ